MLCNILLTFLISSIAIDAHVTRAEQWPSTNATEKCAISENDPDIWTKSNASAFLEAFLRKNGPVDWLHNMDLATTAGGSQGSSSLHCDQYPAQDVCPFPSLRCTDFTPPEVYFIRMAAASMYSFHALVGTLIDTLFGQEGLELDSIMQDLKPKEYKQPLALSIVNNLLFFIYAVKLDFPADTIFSLAMAAFGTARSLDMLNEKTSKEFPAAEIKHYLRQIWQEQNQDIRSAMSAIFKGIDVPQTPLDKLLPEEGNWNHDAQRIAMIFSSSNWIQDKATTSVRAEETVKIFGRNLQKAIVGQALSQYGMGIFVETHWKLNEKGEEPAVTDEAICHHYAEGRWMNVTTKHPRPGWPEYYNHCLRIGEIHEVCNAEGAVHFKPIAPERSDKLYTKYNITLEEIYQNAVECALSTKGDHFRDLTPVEGTNLPRCLYNLRVVVARLNLSAGSSDPYPGAPVKK